MAPLKIFDGSISGREFFRIRFEDKSLGYSFLFPFNHITIQSNFIHIHSKFQWSKFYSTLISWILNPLITLRLVSSVNTIIYRWPKHYTQT
ncbi:hypothetical protein IGI04_005924 [Brassica rapa subsp. trilocularis]|uniref:Uncharacterized protein n=1 Tax=Brassica rapa subsp. trilocularis TaxID=1813537 RepID=A0ABQ7NFE7_BRACM|nr:hypothetical protein IGI04_005924 [Brassica rapa subsp. trilocularis]